MPVEIRSLDASDAREFWDLRLEALSNDPDAFATTVDEHRLLTLKETASRLVPKPDGSLIAGAFVEGKLSAIAGLARQNQTKTRHKALLWGVYATSERRKQGLARSVVNFLLRHARTVDGLDRVLLTVSSHNHAARALYESLGFVRYGLEQASLIVNGNPIDEDLMSLRLR